MIIFYELAIILLLISFVVFCARPLFEAFSHRIRTQPVAAAKESTGNSNLETKVAYLEAEVMELKQQLKGIQESTEFTLSLSQNKSDASRLQELRSDA